MGRGLQGLSRVGSDTSLRSHLQGHSGVSGDKLGLLRAPKDGIPPKWRNEPLQSSGFPRSTTLVAMKPSIRVDFHAGPLPSSDPVHAARGLQAFLSLAGLGPSPSHFPTSHGGWFVLAAAVLPAQ